MMFYPIERLVLIAKPGDGLSIARWPRHEDAPAMGRWSSFKPGVCLWILRHVISETMNKR
jgi:hypothetical protein